MSEIITDYETDEERDFIENKEITDKEKKVLETYDKLKKDIDNLRDMVGKTESRKKNYSDLQDKYEKVRKKILNYFENVNPKSAMKRTRAKIKEMKAEIRESKALYRQSPDIPKAGSLEYGYYIYVAKYQLVAFLEEYYKANPDKEPENIAKILKRNKDRLIDYIFDNFKEDDLPQDLSFFDKYPRPSNIQGQIERKAGIMRLTDEEAEELMNRQDYSNIYEGKNPLGKFTGNEKINLLDHQRKFLNGFFLGNLRSAVVYHGVGTGKTFSAVACVKLYLQLYPKGNVIIITPPAVLFNFIDSLIAYGMNPQDRRISYYSFDRFSRNKGVSTKDSLIIIDEAHNLRTEVVGIIEEEKDAEGNLKYQAQQITKGKRPANFIIKGAEANKIILLTATPFVNTPYDIENLIAIGSSRPPLDKETFGKSVSGKDFRYDYFKYRISKYDRNFLKGDFPEMREKFVGIVPPKDFNNSIEAIAGKANAFYSASRQAGLTLDKIKYCIDIINKNPTKKFVIYSAYVFSGINKIEEELNKNNIQYGFITGGMNVKTIARFIDGYNNFNNKDYQFDKIRVLLISKAGSEGVNLLETRGIFVIDGVWNEALYEQIVARAVRYRSHKALPENEQYVDVYKVFLCFKEELPFLKRLNEGKGFDFQRFLDKFNELKKEMRKASNKVKATSLSNEQLLSGEVKGLTQKAVVDIARKSGDFDEAVFKKLKKGSKERRDYLEKNLTFGKDKAKFEAQNLLKNMKIPSTDFYMFVLQKVKENKIRQFVEELKEIPMIEKTIEDIPKAKKLLEEIKADKLTDEDIIKNLVNALVGNEKEIDTILKKSIKKGVASVDQLIVKMNLLKELRKEKARARLNQEFFTPSYLCEELIKLSGISNRDKFTGLNVLEPSAGWGNICRFVLEVGAKKQLDIKMDAVEFLESNREELKKLVEVIPTAFNLIEQNNFLLFIPSKRYDYIFMNPPFHLQARNNKIYSRDIYDYDFVKRAYSMLKLNGVLVAITGMKWKENDDIRNFYQSIDAEIKEMKGVEWKGEGVRRGQEINKVDISMIYIKKLVVNSEIDNEILDLGSLFFKDFEKEIKIVKPKTLPIPAPEEPKEPKEEPKELLQTEIEDLIDIYDKKKLDSPVPFNGGTETQHLALNYVMGKNKNDCIIPMLRKSKFQRTIYEFVFKGMTIYNSLNSMDKKIKFDFNEEALRLTKRYLECKKNKKILCVPVSLKIQGGHQGIVIFNYIRKEMERFEPHGAEAGHISSKSNKVINNSFEKLVKLINLNLEKEDKIKYVPPYEICPAGFKGFQSHENEQKYKTENFGRYNIYVKKDDGYCVAWSFFYLDLRLNNLKLEGNEIYTRTIKKVEKEPILLKKFIRGMTNDIYEVSLNIIDKLQRKYKWNDEQAKNWFLVSFFYHEWKETDKKSFNKFIKSEDYDKNWYKVKEDIFDESNKLLTEKIKN